MTTRTAFPRTAPPRLMERSNDDWVADLGADGPARDRALADLRPVLVRALQATVRPRVDRGADALVEDLAQNALVHLSDRLDQFRGDARFTTWAQKVAVRLAFSELRRKRWNDVPLDVLVAAPPEAPEPALDDALATREAVALTRRLIAEELTERQRTALDAVMMGVPLEDLAERMETNRNALYKLLHDARVRLRKAFEARGLSANDLLPPAA